MRVVLRSLRALRGRMDMIKHAAGVVAARRPPANDLAPLIGVLGSSVPLLSIRAHPRNPRSFLFLNRFGCPPRRIGRAGGAHALCAGSSSTAEASNSLPTRWQ